MKNFLQVTDFTLSEIEKIFQQAARFKAARKAGHAKPLTGQTWALVFEKPSTRTRVSFEVGVHELGGHPMYMDGRTSQMGRGETIEDTAKVLSGFVHGIVLRTFEHEKITTLAEHAKVPVINALTDLLHPCQLYADAFTLCEHWAAPEQPMLDALKGRKVAFYGDCASNMAHSWILTAALFGMELRLAGPADFAPQPIIDDLLVQAGLPKTYHFATDAKEAADGADCLYTDVWVSMGDEAEKEARLKAMMPYQVNEALMAVAAPNALFLHCLPAHEGEEVSAGVYQSPASVVFQEAENRLHVQKAILAAVAENQLS